MNVLGFDMHPDVSFAEHHGIEYVPADELLKNSDIVTLHLGLNPETRGGSPRCGSGGSARARTWSTRADRNSSTRVPSWTRCAGSASAGRLSTCRARRTCSRCRS